MSAANASTAPTSAGTTTTHKRAASQLKLDSQTAGPSVIHLFVKNVRLLDLDLLPDWPVLTPTSLSNQDARVRIRGTEWCLYQLFKKYDPSTTADKLQPFFPPLEPLQSINLRAALYRCLNELKKNGVLGRDIVLRKSMLDECQGDKFWELCLSFSSIVLRKVHIDRRNDQSRPVAERIGAASAVTKSSRESMLPLSIAHRAALTKVLQEKERKRDTFARLYDVLVQKDASLQRRKARVDRNSRNQPTHAGSRADRVKVAQDVLDNQWVGSTELQAALIYGGDATGGDSLLKIPFDDIWEANQQERLPALNTSEANVLDDLDARARQQRRRLERWQFFHSKLLRSKPASAATATAPVPKRDMPLCFDRHQNLSIHDMEDIPRSASEPQQLERIAALAKYDEILTAMREELRRNVEPGRVPTREAVSDARRQAQRPAPVSSHEMSPSPTDGHRRSPSQTAVPMRPLLGRRTSSARSRSYNQPKVISQRELVPLKSELFSPIKGKRMSGVYGTSSFRASPVDDALESNLDDILDATSERLRQGSTDGSNPHDSGYGLGMISSRTSSASGSSSPRLSKASADVPDSAIDVASTRSSLTRHPSDAMSSRPVPIRASLADRTRLSMAFRGAAGGPDNYNNTNTNHSANGFTAEPETLSSLSDDLPPPASTLMERTRQSISMAPPGPSPGPLRVTKNTSSHSRSRTSIVYPVNQFETPPPKTRRRASLTAAPGPAAEDDDVEPGADVTLQAQHHPALLPRRDFTPREQLFAADAEYDSVFKARPKIALSPVLSPRDSGHGQMGEEDAAFGKLDHDEAVAAVGRESPLLR